MQASESDSATRIRCGEAMPTTLLALRMSASDRELPFPTPDKVP